MTTALAKNTLGGTRPRNPGDAYYTPDALALAITRALRDRLGLEPDLVIEPSAGEGAFVRAARATWPGTRIAATEPYGSLDALTTAGADQVQDKRWEDAGIVPADDTLVLGNPPYNLPGDGRGNNPTTAERHTLLALDRLLDGSHVAFLLRLAFLGGGGRIDRLYSRHPLRALWPVTPRPSFTGGGTDASEYGVFVWRKGWTGPCDVRPLRWPAAGGAAC